ncbi:MAG: transmembrane anchor protein [Pseudolabrys sp.]|nr:transmembrane anchor protein [Pseudolabrys sp.]MDP2298080.1 transmembrane anchor protein [Pseudolabrys sp.]
MYNSDIPTRAELPSTTQLLKSTAIALVAAAVILVTIVLPAEYAIDPTGVGRLLKLTEMGEIKTQLAAEAEADRIKDQGQQPATDKRSGSFGTVLAQLFISPAAASERPVVMAQAAASRTDETVITLKPTEGTEYKMELSKGAQVQFAWSVEGGTVNYDLHGTPKGGGKEQSYKAARGVASDKGVLTAGFDGTHGWFFRNRGSAPVTVKLTTTGAYKEIKKVM